MLHRGHTEIGSNSKTKRCTKIWVFQRAKEASIKSSKPSYCFSIAQGFGQTLSSPGWVRATHNLQTPKDVLAYGSRRSDRLRGYRASLAGTNLCYTDIRLGLTGASYENCFRHICRRNSWLSIGARSRSIFREPQTSLPS